MRSIKHLEGSQRPPSWPQVIPMDVFGPFYVTGSLIFIPWCQKYKINQRLPMVFTSLNVSQSGFLKLVMFWIWRHQDITLWRHSGNAWDNAELTLLTTWLDCGQRVKWVILNHYASLHTYRISVHYGYNVYKNRIHYHTRVVVMYYYQYDRNGKRAMRCQYHAIAEISL